MRSLCGAVRNRYDSGLRLTLPIGDMAVHGPGSPAPAPHVTLTETPHVLTTQCLIQHTKTENVKTEKREFIYSSSDSFVLTGDAPHKFELCVPRLFGRSRSRGELGEQTITPPPIGALRPLGSRGLARAPFARAP